MTTPATAPPERLDDDDDDDWVSADWRSGATIGVEVTVSVTGSPEMVTTRVLVTGEGVADSGTEELESEVMTGASTFVEEKEEEVSGGGVELVLEVVGVRDEEDYDEI